MKIKICGMKYKDNILEVAKLQPDYLGFIFYKNSARSFDNLIPELEGGIKKVGVFVNAPTQLILHKAVKHDLDAVQLHGNESVEYIKNLNHILIDSSNKVPAIIKAFSIDDHFDFKTLNPYKDLVNYFLFDTKGKLPGGNGVAFDWKLLNNYSLSKPYFLSGGIGPKSIPELQEFLKSKASKFCEVIDINSRLEIKAGLKDVEMVSGFKKELEKLAKY